MNIVIMVKEVLIQRQKSSIMNLDTMVKHMIVDHRTAARLIQNSDGYNGQAIRLLSCNTGSLDDGFAQNLANKLNVKVSAPTNYLWATKNGDYFVAGMTSSRMPDMKNIGYFKIFIPGGNK